MPNLRCEPTDLPDVRVITPAVYPDSRGNFREVYRRDTYAAAGVPQEFVQDNQSHSAQHVLRGLHFQTRKPQGKLICVLRGSILDVVVDLRRGSPTFGRHLAIELSEQNNRQLFVPAGFAHGFGVLSATADVLYKCTDFYDPGAEAGIRWDDPGLGIVWPIAAPVLSAKDLALPRLAEIPVALLPVFTPA
jgi:dTDP-4-dehydrorhamnose 3,5-epimerase